MIRSLRLRLFLIIVIPLMVLGGAVGSWRIAEAQKTADAFFDRNLMFTALAVSRDVSLSDGDAISPETERLLGETAGGPVRYHVYAPDGVLVTGYAVPPVPVTRRLPKDTPFLYTDAHYKGAPVRVLRLKSEARIDGLSGTFTITVWQDLAARGAFARQQALRAGVVIASLILAVALLVWFGVRTGLKPLLDLEDAISRRSPEDLSPIRRAVPVETQGLVGRLNALFSRVAATLEAQAAFVSDAAHQLRNPIAGLLALAQSVQSAPSWAAAQERASDLARAAAEAGQLANRLLTLERARAETGTDGFQRLNLAGLARDAIKPFEAQAAARALTLTLEDPGPPVVVLADPVMLKEAVTNLLHNAFVHGGPAMTHVRLSLHDGPSVSLAISDDGRGVDAGDIPKILSRFGQAGTGQGSGLGLSIAEAIAQRHGGRLDVGRSPNGFRVTMTLPPVPEAPAEKTLDRPYGHTTLGVRRHGAGSETSREGLT